MTRRTIWWAVLTMAVTLSLFSPSALAQTQTMATGAGAGAFPSGTVFNGVSLSALRFGMGTWIGSNGTATGDFESTLLGSTATGPRTVTVVGKSTSGSFPAAGTAILSGVCSVDMGDGTPARSGVPFTVRAVGGAGTSWTLTLSLGSTNLPLATGRSGRINVK